MSTWLRAERAPDGTVAELAGVPPETACFLDGAPAGPCWGRCYPATGADLAAAREWTLTAQAAAALVHDRVAAVVGEGALAALVRLALPAGADPDAPAGAAVETTGRPAGVAAALRLVPAGGTVVLAARPLCPVTALKTYHDMHRPGVRLVPVRWAAGGGGPAADRLVGWALAHLAAGRPGGSAPPAPWHRLVTSAPQRDAAEQSGVGDR